MQVRWDTIVEAESHSKATTIDKQQINSLAVFLPDEILLKHRVQLLGREEFVGVLMFADMSGFTPLCERYSKGGIDGIYQMTATLNGYIGAIVEVIHFYKGDILKFSGDAFLALWKAENNSTVYDVIREVIACALSIQSLLGSFETSVSVILKVKLAISCGNLIFSVIGNETSRQYIITGTPIDDIKNAEKDSTSGDVIVASRAWVHCIEESFEFKYSSSGHVKIIRIIYKPNEKKQENISRKQFDRVSILCQKHIQHRQKLNRKQKFNDEVLESKVIDEFVKSLPQRTSILEAYKNLKPIHLLPFVINNIAQQIQERQSLDYMTEMRAVTIMFINIVPRTMTGISLISALDETYQIICNYVSDISGCVNKVSLFDKDVMFLVIFGLRGINHERESANALKCACRIRGTISSFSYVLSISIGLTSGEVYCGVVGHPLRKEYTVIGDTVNKAARMMCAFVDRVTCDEETFNNAKLPSYRFFRKSTVKLKGISDSGKIFEYVDHDDDPFSKFVSPTDLFIGRQEHVNRFEAILNTCTIRKFAGFGLFFIGKSNIGKSRLLKELRFETFDKRSLSSTFVELKAQNLSSKNGAITLIYEQFYKTVTSKSKGNAKPIGSLHHILNENGLKRIGPIFKDLIVTEQSGQNFSIIFLDNLQFIDKYSWLCILQLIKDHLILFIATIDSEQSTYSEWITEFLKGPKNDMKMVHLNGIDDESVSRLVFQFLKVNAIPKKLIRLLQLTSEGRPGWVQCCLLRIINNGSLEIKLACLDNINQEVYYLNDIKANPMERLRVVIFAESFSFTEKFLTQNKVLMDWFDSFTLRQQLIMKTGCVIGEIFSRQMLKVLMNSPSEEILAQGIRELFDESVLECGTYFIQQCHGTKKDAALSFAGSILKTTTHGSIDSSPAPIFDRFFLKKGNATICTCDEFYSYSYFTKSMDLYNLPKYAFCKLLHMKGENLRIMTYKLLPINQKKELHKRITDLMEHENTECLYCIKNRQRSKIKMCTFAESKPYWVFTNSQRNLTNQNEFNIKLFKTYLNTETPEEFNPDYVERLIKSCVRSDIRNVSLKVQEKRKSVISFKGRSGKDDASNSSFNLDNTKKQSTILSNISTKSQFLNKKQLSAPVFSGVFSTMSNTFHYSSQTQLQTHPADDIRVLGNPLFERSHCYCLEILTSVYSDLIHHTSQAELIGKRIFYTIQRGAVMMMMELFDEAIEILHEAGELCTMTCESGLLGVLPVKFRQYNFAHIHCLISECYLRLLNIKMARNHILLAFRQFDMFPKNSEAWICEYDLLSYDTTKLWKQNWWSYTRRFFKRSSSIMKRQSINGPRKYTDTKGNLLQISYCFFIMGKILMKQSRFRFARMIIMKSFRIVCDIDSDLEIFAEALRDRPLKDRVILKETALDKLISIEKLIYERWKQLTFNAVYVHKLLMILFEILFINGDIIKSLDLGLRVIQTFEETGIETISKVATVLLMNQKISQAIYFMNKMYFSTNHSVNCLVLHNENIVVNWVKMYYFTFALELYLETGVEIVSTEERDDFIACYFTDMKQNNEEIEWKFFTLMFVYNARLRNWEESEKWRSCVCFLEEITDKYYNQFSYEFMYTLFQYLEGLLIYAAINYGFTIEEGSMPRKTKSLKITSFDSIVNVCYVFLKDEWEIFKPRCLHLIAYSFILKKSTKIAYEFLDDAEKIAKKHHNLLELAWIECDRKYWCDTTMPMIRINSISTNYDEMNDLSRDEWADMMFSLPRC